MPFLEVAWVTCTTRFRGPIVYNEAFDAILLKVFPVELYTCIVGLFHNESGVYDSFLMTESPLFQLGNSEVNSDPLPYPLKTLPTAHPLLYFLCRWTNATEPRCIDISILVFSKCCGFLYKCQNLNHIFRQGFLASELSGYLNKELKVSFYRTKSSKFAWHLFTFISLT